MRKDLKKNEYNAIMAGQGRGSEYAAARKVKQLWLSVKEVEKDMAVALKPLEGMVEQVIEEKEPLDEVGISEDLAKVSMYRC